MLPKHKMALMAFQATPARLSGSPSLFAAAGTGIAPVSRDLQSRAHLSMPPGGWSPYGTVEPGGFAPP
jgi:hypothetical protein